MSKELVDLGLELWHSSKLLDDESCTPKTRMSCRQKPHQVARCGREDLMTSEVSDETRKRHLNDLGRIIVCCLLLFPGRCLRLRLHRCLVSGRRNNDRPRLLLQ